MGEIEVFASTLQMHAPLVRITADSDILHTYVIDGIVPRLIITPSSVEELAKIVSCAYQHDLAVLARGNGSQMNLGALPEQVDVLVETTKLKRLLEYESADLTCHVEAGMMLADVQAQLAWKGQRLALDPPGAQQATIGGILSTNASGPQRLRYGTARDLVIGLRVVQANGDITRSGGRVVKNVAGYDLNKLYIGSLGTLGVIVEANFKLHPLPAAEHTLLLSYTKAEDIMQTVIAIIGSFLSPSALELIDAGAARDMSELYDVNLSTTGYTLAVNFEGSSATIRRQIDEVRLLARKNHALLGDDLEGEQQEHFWNAIREYTQGTLTCKVSILVSQIAAYLQQIAHICQQHDLEATIIAHAGNGILYIELRPSDAIERLVVAIAELRLYAHKARGSLVIERCPLDLKRRINIWGEPGIDFRIMQRLKQQFDPKGIFVKGRFLGGL